MLNDNPLNQYLADYKNDQKIEWVTRIFSSDPPSLDIIHCPSLLLLLLLLLFKTGQWKMSKKSIIIST
jgi:hypothetical protein